MHIYIYTILFADLYATMASGQNTCVKKHVFVYCERRTLVEHNCYRTGIDIVYVFRILVHLSVINQSRRRACTVIGT